MRQEPTKQPPAMIRAYHIPSGTFIAKGALTLDDHFLAPVHSSGELMVMDGVRIELFIGRFANTGQPVYQNDRVRFGIKNEFGSMVVREGVVKYDNAQMSHYIDTPAVQQGAHIVGNLSILEVIGHAI